MMRRAWINAAGTALAALACLALAPAAGAVSYSFFCLTDNVAADCATGEAQLTVDVTDIGGGEVLFTFSNSGPNASSITDVYYDDGSLLALARLIDADDNGGDTGVDFSPLASPGNLPGGMDAVPPFVTTPGFSADSDPPAQPNGVNPGESLGVVFTITGGQTFADVIDELNTAALRLGIHVQGFTGGGSESFINIVPEPGTLGMVALGAAVLAARRSQRA